MHEDMTFGKAADPTGRRASLTLIWSVSANDHLQRKVIRRELDALDVESVAEPIRHLGVRLAAISLRGPECLVVARDETAALPAVGPTLLLVREMFSDPASIVTFTSK